MGGGQAEAEAEGVRAGVEAGARGVLALKWRRDAWKHHFLCFSSLSPPLVPLSWLFGLLLRYILSMALIASVR